MGISISLLASVGERADVATKPADQAAIGVAAIGGVARTAPE